MAHDLTESVTFDSTVTVPDDGDALLASSVVGTFQSLADRSQYNKVNGPDVIAVGVPRFRAGVTTDMQNTAASNGDWFFDINRGLFYAWDGTGPDGVITFDNLVTSGKLWWRYDWNGDTDGYAALIGPNNNSPSTASGKIPQSLQTNYITQVGENVPAGFISQLFTGSTYVVIANSNIQPPADVAVGDIIKFEYSTMIVDNHSVIANDAYIGVHVVEGIGVTNNDFFFKAYTCPQGLITEITITGQWVVKNPGSAAIYLMAKNNDIGNTLITSTVQGPYILGNYMVIRP